MNEHEIDIFLKEKAKSEQTNISLEVGELISYALNNLPKRRNLIKPAIAVAAFLIVSVVTLAMIPPAYAENIPVLKSVFQFFGKFQYLDYTTQVNQSVTDQGYTLTVNEVVADDNLIVVSYTAKSTKPFSKDFSDMPNVFGDLTQSGKLLTNGTGQGKLLDEFNYAGYVSYFVGKDSLPKELDLKFTVNLIDTTHGKWNFSFTVSKSTSKESKVVYPKVAAALPFAKLKVSKVVLSRSVNSLIFNLTYPNKVYNYKFLVLDDKGKALYVIGNEREEGHSNGTTSIKTNLFFVKGKEELKEITLIPFIFNPDYDLDPIKWLSESTKVLPIVFHPSNDSTVSVKKIESDNFITKVYYSVEGLYPDGYAAKMVLIDDKGKVIIPSGSEILIDPDTNEFMTQFDSLNPNREYKVATPQLNDLQILKENKISVPLK